MKERERERERGEETERGSDGERERLRTNRETDTVPSRYGVALVSRIDTITGLFCRIASLL